MKKTFIISCLSALIFLLNCSPKLAIMVTSEPIYTSEQIQCLYESETLAQGRQIMINHCSKCHKIHDLTSFTPTQWNHILRNMIPYTKISYEEARLLRAYVLNGSAE